MKRKTKWIPLTLTLLVLPGMGHLYLKQKLKGIIFVSLSLVITIGGLARYMYVLFALANVNLTPRPPKFNPFALMREAWKLDSQILWLFLIALLLIWALAFVDMLFILKVDRKK